MKLFIFIAICLAIIVEVLVIARTDDEEELFVNYVIALLLVIGAIFLFAS